MGTQFISHDENGFLNFCKIRTEHGLKSRRWYQSLSCMFRIMNKEAPNYLINLIPKCEAAIRTIAITIVEQAVSSILFSLLLLTIGSG